ncbi:MAG: hypothetical protein P2A85_10440 [Microcoleus anatoxicus]|uniref:hypothetical protein n=1 Tax=Microcoleus anatoxicus TaxID=2705319 RepID=UPI00366D0E2E
MKKNKILLAICTTTLLLTTSVKLLAQQSNHTLIPENVRPYGAFITQQSLTLSPTPLEKMLTLNETSTVQQAKKETDWIAIIVSILSLAISSVVGYTSSLRLANIKLCVGRNIILFPVPKTHVTTSSVTMAGVGFNLPITFYNWSPQGGTIQRIRLAIAKENDDDFYDMTWTTFVKIETGGFEDDNLAQPIAIKGLSSVNKVIRFDWITELGGRQFEVKPGNYELRIYGWTKNTQKHSLKFTTSFTIKDEDCQNFRDSVAANLSRSIWIPLNENEKPNRFLSRNDIDRFYT